MVKKSKIILFCFSLLYFSAAHSQSGQSCKDPLLIDCNKSFHFDQFYYNTKLNQDCLPCATSFSPVNDIWLELDINKSGDLEFEIIPDEDGNDIDFAIYDLDLGCCQKNAIRCCAASPSNNNSKTGLNDDSKDLVENEGKSKGQDGFISKLLVSKNQHLLLYLHNFNGFKGATINFNNALTLPIALSNYKVQVIPGNLDEVSYSLKSDIETQSVSWAFKESNEIIKREGLGPHLLNVKSLKGYNVLIHTSKLCKLELSNESININKTTENISIYPNPAKDVTQLDLSNIEIRKIAKIQCFQNGKLLLEIPIDKISGANFQLVTSLFPKGMIDVVVVKNDGLVVNSRFVKD